MYLSKLKEEKVTRKKKKKSKQRKRIKEKSNEIKRAKYENTNKSKCIRNHNQYK